MSPRSRERGNTMRIEDFATSYTIGEDIRNKIRQGFLCVYSVLGNSCCLYTKFDEFGCRCDWVGNQFAWSFVENPRLLYYTTPNRESQSTSLRIGLIFLFSCSPRYETISFKAIAMNKNIAWKQMLTLKQECDRCRCLPHV